MEIQVLIAIFDLGSFYALLALAFFMVLQGSGFFNFAMGSYAMFGAITTAYLVSQMKVPVVVGIVAGIAGSTILAILTEMLVVRPIKQRNAELQALVAVVAVLLAIEQFAGTLYGRQSFPGTRVIPTQFIRMSDVVIDPQSILIVVLTVAVFFGVSLWLKRNPLGRMLRAVGDNEGAARILGLPVNQVRLVSFGIGGAICGIAGLMIAPKVGVSFASGMNYALVGFVALVFSGIGSVWAPLAGGLLFSALQLLAVRYLGGSSLDNATLLLAVLLFMFRPQGIFTRRVRV